MAKDKADRFAGLVKPRAFILDGEVAVYDRAFISRFEWLRRRPTDEPATLPVYMAFDLLELDGRDLRRESLKVRRRLLERLVRSHGMVFATQEPIQREVVYPTRKYVLHGDGITYPWQWVWIPAAPPPPPPPAPQPLF